MAAADIQKIYLGLLGRPADAEGLAYWNEEIENGALTLEQLRANIVNEQPEFIEGPGQLSRAEFVAQLYVKMFGREPDENAEYWLTGEGANVNLDQLVLAFTDGASEEDTAALNNRATVAQRITDEGLALEDDVETLLEGVTNDPETVTVAQERVEQRASGEEEDDAPSTGGGGGGGVQNLTINIDPQNEDEMTVAGGNGDDEFTAESSDALTQGLTLNGGAGNDILKATVDETPLSTASMPTISGVETFELTSTGKNSGLLFSRVADVQKVINVGSTETLQLVDINVENTIDLVAKGIGNAANVGEASPNFNVRYSTQKDGATQSLELDNAHLNLVSITALKQENGDVVGEQSGITELNIVSNGDSNTVRTFNDGIDATTIGLQASLKQINISGEGGFTSVQLPDDVTVDGSEATGVLNLVVSSGSTITGGSAADNFNASTDGVTTFKYTAQSQSTVSASDEITGFTGDQSGDVIDLATVLADGASGLVNKAVDGTKDEFGGNAVAWAEADGNTTVYVDVNGNGQFDATSDMQITLVGTSLGLTVDNFDGLTAAA